MSKGMSANLITVSHCAQNNLGVDLEVVSETVLYNQSRDDYHIFGDAYLAAAKFAMRHAACGSLRLNFPGRCFTRVAHMIRLTCLLGITMPAACASLFAGRSFFRWSIVEPFRRLQVVSTSFVSE
jgi:hypothetical protein